MSKETKYKPVISRAMIFDEDMRVSALFDDMEEVRCGNCNQLFGLTTGSARDDSYFKDNYLYCNKCGSPVDWNEEE